ncbi:hypothetical protein AUP68_10573 [Ilyonectria robusta]
MRRRWSRSTASGSSAGRRPASRSCGPPAGRRAVGQGLGRGDPAGARRVLDAAARRRPLREPALAFRGRPGHRRRVRAAPDRAPIHVRAGRPRVCGEGLAGRVGHPYRGAARDGGSAGALRPCPERLVEGHNHETSDILGK